MADLARIKRNVAKMVSMGAPEADIDAYIGQEGVTIDQVRAYKGGPTKLTGTVTPQTAQPEPSANVERAQPAAQQNYDLALGHVRRTYYPQMNDQQWAEYSQRAFAPYSTGNLFAQGQTMGFQDEAAALAGAVGGVFDGTFGQRWNDYKALEEARRNLGREQSGPAGGVAEFAGGMMSGTPTSLGVGTLGQRMLRGGRDAAVLGGLYGFGETDGSIKDRAAGAAKGAAISGAVGFLSPWVGNKVNETLTDRAQRRATSQAIKTTPPASVIKSEASQLFNSADGSGITVTTDAFNRLFSDVQNATAKFRPNELLDQESLGALKAFKDTADALASGQNVVVDLQDLHILRQAAQQALVSGKPRDATIAGRIIDQIDSFVAKLKPSDIAGGADPKAAANALLKGISLWHRAGKMSLIEEAIRVGKLAASGEENGIRNAFRSIAKNPDVWKRFNHAEQQAIMEVIDGRAPTKILRWLSKFRGIIGFGIGSMNPLGPIAGVGTVLAAKGAEKGAEALTNSAANRAIRVMGTPNIPQVPRPSAVMPSLPEQVLKRMAIGAASL